MNLKIQVNLKRKLASYGMCIFCVCMYYYSMNTCIFISNPAHAYIVPLYTESHTHVCRLYPVSNLRGTGTLPDLQLASAHDKLIRNMPVVVLWTYFLQAQCTCLEKCIQLEYFGPRTWVIKLQAYVQPRQKCQCISRIRRFYGSVNYTHYIHAFHTQVVWECELCPLYTCISHTGCMGV